MIHEILYWTGISNPGQTPTYNATSGVVPCIIGLITVLSGVFVYIKHHNCNVKGCKEVFTHPVVGTPFRACKNHHPAIDEKNYITAEVIKKAHEEAMK